MNATSTISLEKICNKTDQGNKGLVVGGDLKKDDEVLVNDKKMNEDEN